MALGESGDLLGLRRSRRKRGCQAAFVKQVYVFVWGAHLLRTNLDLVFRRKLVWV